MARIPDHLRLYAIGDIHGRADLLDELCAKIEAEEKRRPPAASHLIFLGDYVDRGPDTHGVIERLLHGLPAGLEADFLMGNHERMLLDALDDDEAGVLWLANGGGQVIESYAVAASVRGEHADHWGGLEDVLPPEHLEFLQSLKLTAQYGDYFFVHAGVRPEVPLDLQSSLDLLWIRSPFLDFAGSFGKVIVHGHTPVEAVEFHPNRIAIDTGAVFTGRLSALVLEGDRRDVLST